MRCGVAIVAVNDADLPRVKAGDWSRPPIVPDHEVWHKALQLGELVEPLGFDSIWASEHFATPYGMCPNTLQFLAYWAGRTRKIDVGTLVVIAPWWHPVKLAHEIAMLDILLQGRTYTIGLGRGLSPKEYGPLGIDQSQSRQRFDEAVDILRLAFTQERFSYDGEIFKIPEMSLRPQPQHRDMIHDAVGAFMTPGSREAVARSGLGHIVAAGQSTEQIAADNREFNKIRAEMGLPPARPIVYLLGAYCSEDRVEAHEKGLEYIQLGKEMGNWHYGFTGEGATDFGKIKGYEAYAAMNQTAAPQATPADALSTDAMVGTPDDLIDKITSLQKATGCSEVILAFQVAGAATPKDETERSMRLFAEKVLPTIKALKVEETN